MDGARQGGTMVDEGLSRACHMHPPSWAPDGPPCPKSDTLRGCFAWGGTLFCLGGIMRPLPLIRRPRANNRRSSYWRCAGTDPFFGFSIARHTRYGVHGMSIWRMP